MRSDGIVNDNARVSTYGPTLDTQSDQLRTAGCSSRNIYSRKRQLAHRAKSGRQRTNLTGDHLWDANGRLAPDGFRQLSVPAVIAAKTPHIVVDRLA